MRSAVRIIVLLCCTGLTNWPSITDAGEPTNSLFSISKTSDFKFRTNLQFAILLAGNDSELTKIVEDSLAIHLINAGFKVGTREELELAVARGLASTDQAGGALGTIEIGKAVKAQLILTGTVFLDITESKPLLVKEASLQLLDVASEGVLLRVIFEWQEGGGLSDLGGAFLKTLEKLK